MYCVDYSSQKTNPDYSKRSFCMHFILNIFTKTVKNISVFEFFLACTSKSILLPAGIKKSTPCQWLDCVTRKGPLYPESLSYQKKDGCTCPRPPFFWYDAELKKKLGEKNWEKKFQNFFKRKNLKSWCHTKRSAPVLLLVWQWLRTSGTFSCNSAQLTPYWSGTRYTTLTCLVSWLMLSLDQREETRSVCFPKAFYFDIWLSRFFGLPLGSMLTVVSMSVAQYSKSCDVTGTSRSQQLQYKIHSRGNVNS